MAAHPAKHAWTTIGSAHQSLNHRRHSLEIASSLQPRTRAICPSAFGTPRRRNFSFLYWRALTTHIGNTRSDLKFSSRVVTGQPSRIHSARLQNLVATSQWTFFFFLSARPATDMRRASATAALPRAENRTSLTASASPFHRGLRHTRTHTHTRTRKQAPQLRYRSTPRAISLSIRLASSWNSGQSRMQRTAAHHSGRTTKNFPGRAQRGKESQSRSQPCGF